MKREKAQVAEMTKATEQQTIIIAEKQYEKLGATQFKFVQADGILDILATLMACGYTREEIVKRIKIDPTMLEMITKEQIDSKRKHFSDAILMAADQRVYHDLVSGGVGKETEMVDRIAGRRRKLMLDALKTAKDIAPPDKMGPAEVDEKKKLYADRFGLGKEMPNGNAEK